MSFQGDVEDLLVLQVRSLKDEHIRRTIERKEVNSRENDVMIEEGMREIEKEERCHLLYEENTSTHTNMYEYTHGSMEAHTPRIRERERESNDHQ